MSVKSARLLSLGIAAAVVLIPAATPPDAHIRGSLKIATQGPLSGTQSTLGEGIKRGAELAIEAFKADVAKRGFAIELTSYDDEATPDVGVANAKTIVADPDIIGVIGHLDGSVAIPASDIYKDVNLAMISPATTAPALTDRGYQNLFRVSGRDDVQGVAGSEFAHGTLKVKSVSVVHDKTPYGQAVADAFRLHAEKRGIKILGVDGTEETSNFNAIITVIRSKNPDLIYFAGTHEQAAPFFRQAREKGVKARFMGPNRMDSPELAKVAGKAAIGMYYTTLVAPAAVYPHAKEFAEAYKRKYGKDPAPFAAQAYDATAILLKAIATAAAGGKTPTRDTVTAAIRDVKHAGITGTVEFDARGDPKKAAYFVFQVASDDSQKWGDNKEVRRLTVATSAAK